MFHELLMNMMLIEANLQDCMVLVRRLVSWKILDKLKEAKLKLDAMD